MLIWCPMLRDINSAEVDDVASDFVSNLFYGGDDVASNFAEYLFSLRR